MRNALTRTALSGGLLMLASGLAALALPASDAEARSRVGVGIGFGFYVPPPYYYPRYHYPPYYYYPPPAYYYPPPAYYYPPPPPVPSGNPTSSQAYCREYTATTTINGQPERVTGTACLQPDGTWRIVR
jgi:hypothetical protein